MIFYKFICLNQTKEVLVDKEFLTEMVKQDLIAYNDFCEEQQDEGDSQKSQDL